MFFRKYARKVNLNAANIEYATFCNISISYHKFTISYLTVFRELNKKTIPIEKKSFRHLKLCHQVLLPCK